MKNKIMNVEKFIKDVKPSVLKEFMSNFEVKDEHDGRYIYAMYKIRELTKQQDKKIYYWSSKNKVGYILESETT
jgi:hypothetical protein